jgi:hypothetical protein
MCYEILHYATSSPSYHVFPCTSKQHLILSILPSGSSFGVRLQGADTYKTTCKITIFGYFNLCSFRYETERRQILEQNVVMAMAVAAVVVALHVHKILRLFTPIC